MRFDAAQTFVECPVDGFNIWNFHGRVGEDHSIIGYFALDRVAISGCGIAEKVPVASERNSNLEFGRVNKCGPGPAKNPYWLFCGTPSLIAVGSYSLMFVRSRTGTFRV